MRERWRSDLGTDRPQACHYLSSLGRGRGASGCCSGQGGGWGVPTCNWATPTHNTRSHSQGREEEPGKRELTPRSKSGLGRPGPVFLPRRPTGQEARGDWSRPPPGSLSAPFSWPGAAAAESSSQERRRRRREGGLQEGSEHPPTLPPPTKRTGGNEAQKA